MLIALALSCAILWHSWEGKVRIFFTCFSPRMVAKEANEHESAWGVGQVRLVGQIGLVGLVRHPILIRAHSPLSRPFVG